MSSVECPVWPGGVCPHPLPQPRPHLQPRLAGGGPRGALPAAGRPPQHPAPPGHRRQPRHRPRHGGGHLRQLPHLLHVLSGVAIYRCSVTFIREVDRNDLTAKCTIYHCTQLFHPLLTTGLLPMLLLAFVNFKICYRIPVSRLNSRRR